MKKILSSILAIFFIASAGTMRAENIGVPSECEDVMLQVFYWDSYKLTKYGRTKWMDLNADTVAIRDNFDLVWFPPSASGGGVGYTPKQYSTQDSDWGSRQTLTKLIAALHRGNTKAIADIVINHRGNNNTWCNFLQDYFGTYGNYQLTADHICKNDEVNSDSKAGSCKGAATGEYDTGTNFDGARDLDHTNEYVQSWAKAYLKWLKSSMLYDGFRYDMTKGYNGKYLSMYNEEALPYLSVSECWDNVTVQKNHLNAANKNTMIFDFPLKFSLNDFYGGSYGKLNKAKNTNSLRAQGLEKYSVTFVDNHDTFERDDSQGSEFGGYLADLGNTTVKNYILQANAYILSMPGVPCVFWPHWKSYKSEINELIAVRKRAGIHSESEVTDEQSGLNLYSATIKGHRGSVVLRLGSRRSTLGDPEGYEVAVEGGDRGAYTIFIRMNDQAVENVEGESLKGVKFMKDGHLYIRRGEQVYDILGNKIQ